MKEEKTTSNKEMSRHEMSVMNTCRWPPTRPSWRDRRGKARVFHSLRDDTIIPTVHLTHRRMREVEILFVREAVFFFFI